MSPEDHMKTASWRNSKSAQKYRKKQEELVQKGKFKKAQNMDIKDVRKLFGNKYDEGIEQMEEYTNELIKKGVVK